METSELYDVSRIMRETHVYLLDFFGPDDLQFTAVPVRDQVTVGRQTGNTVMLPDATVSAHHATFFLTIDEHGDSHVELKDEDSTNGCVVNRDKFRGESRRIHVKDSIRLGRFVVELRRVKNVDGIRLDETVPVETEWLRANIRNRKA